MFVGSVRHTVWWVAASVAVATVATVWFAIVLTETGSRRLGVASRAVLAARVGSASAAMAPQLQVLGAQLSRLDPAKVSGQPGQNPPPPFQTIRLEQGPTSQPAGVYLSVDRTDNALTISVPKPSDAPSRVGPDGRLVGSIPAYILAKPLQLLNPKNKDTIIVLGADHHPVLLAVTQRSGGRWVTQVAAARPSDKPIAISGWNRVYRPLIDDNGIVAIGSNPSQSLGWLGIGMTSAAVAVVVAAATAIGVRWRRRRPEPLVEAAAPVGLRSSKSRAAAGATFGMADGDRTHPGAVVQPGDHGTPPARLEASSPAAPGGEPNVPADDADRRLARVEAAAAALERLATQVSIVAVNTALASGRGDSGETLPGIVDELWQLADAMSREARGAITALAPPTPHVPAPVGQTEEGPNAHE
jgi:hypothetical protein